MGERVLLEALRKSYIALLAAACDAPSNEAAHFYDSQAKANRRVLEAAGVLAPRTNKRSAEAETYAAIKASRAGKGRRVKSVNV